MKKMLLVTALIVVAFSGCLERGTSETGLTTCEIETLAFNSSDNLSTYSVISSVNQTLMLKGATENNATQGNNVTIIAKKTKTMESVDLANYRAAINDSTEDLIEVSGKATNTSSHQAAVYLILNSTYFKGNGGNWTHLKDPRPIEEIWGEGKDNQVKALVEMINQSYVNTIGSEKIDGEDAYKLKISPRSGNYSILHNIAFHIAAELVQNPLLMPEINSTELNESSEMEIWIWISKETYLPKKFQSIMSFKITPVIIGGLDSSTGEMKRFNQSIVLGEVSAKIERTERYYDFNKPVVISLPEDALKTAPIIPGQKQVAS